MVKSTVDDLLTYGEVHRGDFGMKVRAMDTKNADMLNTSLVTGILVDTIEIGGAADRGELKSSDIVTMIDGIHVESIAQVSEFVAPSYQVKRYE